MPAYRKQEAHMAVLNRAPTAGFSFVGISGCFANGVGKNATGEHIWATFSEQTGRQNSEDEKHNYQRTVLSSFVQVGQDVGVNFGGRHLTANGLRKLPYNSAEELSLQNDDALRTNVTGGEDEIFPREEPYTFEPGKRNGGDQAGASLWKKRTSPLLIRIPNHDEPHLDSQELADAEEKMAAAVLTSLSLSPVLTKMRFEDDRILEENEANKEDEAIPFGSLLDQESPKGRNLKSRRRKNSLKTVFQCTWPRCGKTVANSSAIIRHVRGFHLGPKKDEDDGYSDGEEEFYFIEVEMDADDPTDPSSEGSLSPPISRLTPRRSRSLSDPDRPTQSLVTSRPLHVHVDDNFIWPLRTTGGRGKGKRSLHQTAHPGGRKARGDGKKCRKVFGMENKHLWCTQCRWKKACIKFVD